MVDEEKDILVQRMMKVSRQGWRYAKEKLSHPKMPNMLYNVCCVIYLHSGISQDGVAHYLQTDKSSIAKVVSKGVKAGYIVREVNPEDHREYQLHLTQEGTESVKEVLGYLLEWQNKVLTVLNDRDRKKFRELFEKISASAEDVAAE